MGHKTNTITLRNSFLNLNLASLSAFSLFTTLNFLKSLKYLLKNYGVFIISEVFNIKNNQIFLNLTLFFKSTKFSFFKKKINKSSLLEKKTLLNIFYKNFNFSLTKINLNCIVINKFLNKSILTLLFVKTKKFIPLIFSRRFNLYIDFLKILNLYLLKKIVIKQLLDTFVQIFRFISKKLHSNFITFLKSLFNLLIFDKQLEVNKMSIKGVKFLLAGKLQGKARSTSSFIQQGALPMQSLTKNIEYKSATAFTLLGTFGLKLWIYR